LFNMPPDRPTQQSPWKVFRNAVDAALGAVMASLACEPGLTSLGAGGYMLVATPEGEDVLLDFFIEAPGRGGATGPAVPLIPVNISFGDADQVFNVGPASCGPYGMPSGICVAHRRFATLPLSELAAPAVRLAREGVLVNGPQAYIYEILDPIAATTTEARALLRVEDRCPVEGDVLHQPELATALERLVVDAQLRRRLAENARQRFQADFTAERMTRHLEDRLEGIARADA